MFERDISRSSTSDLWGSLAGVEKLIVVSIVGVLIVLGVLFFSSTSSRTKTSDPSQRPRVSPVQKDNGPGKQKSLKFITDDAYFISSSSGSITNNQLTVEAVVCIPKNDPGQYNLITLAGDTHDLFTSSYTMQESGRIDTYYSILLGDDTYLSASAPISSTICHHVAVTASSEDGRCEVHVFTDGTKASSATRGDECRLSSRPYTQFIIGSTIRGYKSFHGTIDEVRVSDIVRYTGSFTPSSHPFTVDEHTKHLFHFDGDTSDAAGGNPSGETKGTEYTDGVLDTFPSGTPTPTPTSSISGPGNFPLDVPSPTPTGYGLPLSPSRSPTPSLPTALRSPTPSIPGYAPSATPIPGLSSQQPPTDSENYILPGPPPESFYQSALFSYKHQSYMSIPDRRMSVTSSYTIEAWVRPVAEPPGLYIPAVIISKASPQTAYRMPFSLQLGMYLDSVVPYFSVDANNTRYAVLATQGQLTYNQWHHIAATVQTQQGIIRVYVNGVLSGERQVGKSLVIIDPHIATTIGALCLDEYNTGSCSSYSLHYNGEIEEVRISKVVRYAQNFSPPLSPLAADYDTLAIYRFDGNVQDSSGRNNHGSLYGIVSFPQSTVGMSDDTLPTPTLP